MLYTVVVHLPSCAHELKHAGPPCPSPFPRVCSDSCPLSQWCYPTPASPSPLALNLSQHQGLFQWVGLSHQVAKILELWLQHQSFQWIFRVDFLFDWLVWSSCVPWESQGSFQHHNLKASMLWHSAFFMVQLSHLYMITGKTTVMTIVTFVCKVMSLLFSMVFSVIYPISVI